MEQNTTSAPAPARKYPRSVRTTWALRTYDVWGNARDGWEVNDTLRSGRAEIRCKVEIHNAGTEHEFVSAGPTLRQILRAFGLQGSRIRESSDGDDVSIYLEERNGKPFGVIHCESHDSLSPIRATAQA